STDSGATWSILKNPLPAYNVSSLYSFGEEFGEGDSIPGWGGELSNWTKVTIDLTAYTNGTAMIRFAFASDPAVSGLSDNSLFGWMIDSITVTNGSNILFSNNGEENGMTGSNNAELGGNLWILSTDSGLPSGLIYAEVNDVTKNTYNPNMINYLVSEYFELPDTITTAYFDFYLKGSFVDNDRSPNPVDYWTVVFLVEGETEPRYLSNITRDPQRSNFVYLDAPLTWQRFSSVYQTGLVDLAPLKGKSIRIIVEWVSDGDEPQGRALQIDDIVIYSPVVSTGVNDENGLPHSYNMEQNYPNPFNPSTTIKFSLPVKSDVVIRLYNILGKEIKVLTNNIFEAGNHEIQFKPDGLSSGVYFYSISATGNNGKTFVQTKKLTLMK
ncbi:MAG: T9SS C-terminal target domain-containing protein, partial [Nitrosopumilales archaeon]